MAKDQLWTTHVGTALLIQCWSSSLYLLNLEVMQEPTGYLIGLVFLTVLSFQILQKHWNPVKV